MIFFFPTLKIFSHDSQAWFCLAVLSNFGYIWIDMVEFCCSCIMSRGWCVLNINQVFSWYHPLRWWAFFGSLGKFDCFLHYFSLKSCMCMSMQKQLQTRTYQVHMIYITYLPHVTRDTIDGLAGWKSTAWKKNTQSVYTVYLVTYCTISVCIFIY